MPTTLADPSAVAPAADRHPLFKATVRLSDWLTRHVAGFGLLLVAIFLTGGIVRDVRRPIWYDEIFTREIARLSPALMWRALTMAVDNQPYPFYLITHYSQQLFGDTYLALRLPATAGFTCMGVCIFFFLRRRVHPLCALAASMLPLTALNVTYFASEGRPYGLVLGFCGLILVCWQAAAEHRHRSLALAGLALSVAGAISSHYFAILLLPPILLGELIRTRQNRRLDLPVVGSIMAGFIPLLAFAPQIAAMHVYKDKFWAQPSVSDVVNSFRLSLGIVTVGVMLAIVRYIPGIRSPGSGSARPVSAIRSYEIAAAAGLFMLPLIELAAFPVTGAYHFRYGLGTIVGSSILAGFVIDRLGWKRPATGLLFVALTTGILMYRWASDLKMLRLNSQLPLPSLLQVAAHSELPVVSADGMFFLEQYDKHDAALDSHFWYIADAVQARRLNGLPFSDLGLKALRDWAELPVVGADNFVAAHPSFELIVFTKRPSWQLRYFREKGAKITLEASDEPELNREPLQLYRVDTALP